MTKDGSPWDVPKSPIGLREWTGLSFVEERMMGVLRTSRKSCGIEGMDGTESMEYGMGVRPKESYGTDRTECC